MNITTLGIDLAKNIFQLHGVNEQGETELTRKLTRRKLIEFMVKLPCCLVVVSQSLKIVKNFEKIIPLGAIMQPRHKTVQK